MPSIEIDDVGSIGVIKDQPAYMLPPEAWSLAENVRIIDDGIGRLDGNAQIFGTPGVAPYFGMNIISATQSWFLYAGLAKAYVYDGSTHTNITRQSGGVDVDYTASLAADWNGTILGGVPLLNNGKDIPQFWAAYATSQKLANLTNWPSTLRAKVLRAFGPYLMALNCTESSVNKPHLMRWSHPADPGTIPVSWDITDETKDAGEVDFPDVESGLIEDGLPLQGRFYVYKGSSIWRVRATGNRLIFDEDAFLETIGALCTRAVAITGDGKQHVFMSQDNLFLHDGNSARPMLDKKMKRTLFNAIDVTNYRNSFMMVNPLRDEAWFCYPEGGRSLPNRAVILNYKTLQITEGDVDFQSASSAIVESSDTETWATASGSWDTDLNPWSNSNRRKVVLCKPATTKLSMLDSGSDRDGTAFTGTLQRTGLGIIGRKRNGDWIEDFQQRKLVTRIWPKITGGAVNIRLGAQELPDGPVTWSPAVTFDPATQKYADIIAQGAAIAMEISGATGWKLNGYKLEMSLLGNF